MKPRLLVVEDETIVAMDIHDRLQALGYEPVGECADGPEAIALTERLRPDLVLMDIRLQGEMDGIAAAKEIRSRLDVPVIFLTAHSEQATLERAKGAEPLGYILKPFQDRELHTTVEMGLAKHRSDREIKRLNRLYAVLSQVNQAIVWSSWHEELFDRVCRLSIDHGGFLLAWIGWLNPDTQEISPVARAGNTEGYLDRIKHYAADRPGGYSLTGEAVREGGLFVCNDMAEDPRLREWCEADQRMGFRSAAAIPLRRGGQICAALMLYSGERDYFQEAEVKLVQEVGVDLSFALDQEEKEVHRRKTEGALRESERRFRNLFEHAPVGIYRTNPDGRVLMANPALLAMLGCETFGELVASPWGKGQWGEAARREQFRERLEREGAITGFESVWTRRDGSTLHVRENAKAVRLPVGTLAFYEGTAEDITEHKLAETLAAVQKDLAIELSATTRMADALGLVVRAVLRISGLDCVAIYLVNPDSGALELAAHGGASTGFFEQVSRFPADSPVALQVRDGQRIYAPVGTTPSPIEALLQAEGIRVRAVIPVPHGGKVIASLNTASHQHDRIPEVVRAALEAIASQLGSVIARFRAEEELRQRQAELDATYTNAPIILCLLDAQLRVHRLNRAGAEFAGLPEVDLSGKRGCHMLGCTRVDACPAALGQPSSCPDCPLCGTLSETLTTGRSQKRVELRMDLHRAGADRTAILLASTALIRVERESLVLLCLEDITEHRRADQAKAKLEEQLRQAQKMEAIGTLAGGIAHDFNNILSAILGNIELAGLELTSEHPAMECLTEVDRAGRRAVDLVKQILAFSRRQEQQRQVTRLEPIVKETLKLLRAAIPSTVALQHTIHPGCPTVLADSTQIHQVLMNLCTNAYHALPERDGTIQVALEPIDVDEVLATEHAGLRQGHYARLAVADNGHGIAPAVLDRIFEPFFTTKASGRGTGLGLSVVLGIVQDHDGAITVTSAPGRGSTFHVYFPACAEEGAPEPGPALPIPQGHGERVLFVDDEAALAALATKVLERLDYQVTALTSPAEALTRFRGEPDAFDLVITDLSMPGLNGLDFARQCLQERPTLPVLLSTGFSGTVTADAVRQLGLRDLILKPFTRRSLGETIHRALTSPPPAQS